MSSSADKTLLVCHGAWSGGWSWKKMFPRAEAAGYRLVVPTYTGLGEREHLAHPGIDLETHIQDILSAVKFEDLNDIVLLGDSGAVYFWKQNADHTLAEPQKIAYSGTPRAVQIADVNSDGKNDLVLVDFDSPTPYHVRFQIADGQLGPETYFKTQPVRSFWVDNLGGDKTNYLTGIVTATGRAEVSQFTRQPGEVLSGAFRTGQFQVMPLNKTDAGARGILWSDVDGDGRPDLLVAEHKRYRVGGGRYLRLEQGRERKRGYQRPRSVPGP